MSKTKEYKISIIVIFLTSVLYCSNHKKGNLIETIDAYHHYIRWARYEEASSMVHHERRKDFLDFYREISEILNITDYKIFDIVNIDNNKSIVILEWRYFLLPDNIEKKQKIEEVWVKKSGGFWLMEGYKVVPQKDSNNPSN